MYRSSAVDVIEESWSALAPRCLAASLVIYGITQKEFSEGEAGKDWEYNLLQRHLINSKMFYID